MVKLNILIAETQGTWQSLLIVVQFCWKMAYYVESAWYGEIPPFVNVSQNINEVALGLDQTPDQFYRAEIDCH